MIETGIAVLLFITGIVFFAFGQAHIETISVVIMMGMIFGLPTLFSFGFGDLLVFLALGLFMTSLDEMWMFLGIFIVVWIAWTFIMLYKYNKEERITDWKSAIKTKEYPLIPAITVAFGGWLIWLIGF